MWTYNYICPSELYHHGIKGQKWGVRRYQNLDGSLIKAEKKLRKKEEQHRNDLIKKYEKKGYSKDDAVLKANKNVRIKKDALIYALDFVDEYAAYKVYKIIKERKNNPNKYKDMNVIQTMKQQRIDELNRR